MENPTTIERILITELPYEEQYNGRVCCDGKTPFSASEEQLRMEFQSDNSENYCVLTWQMVAQWCMREEAIILLIVQIIKRQRKGP